MEIKQPKLYVAIFLLFWSILAIVNSGWDTSEGNYHYAVAEHIIKTGRLGFDEFRHGIFTLAPNGRTYASHEIGNTLFYLPVAFINLSIDSLLRNLWGIQELPDTLRRFIFSFHSVTYTSVTLTALFGILRVLKQEVIPSFIGVSAVAFTTFLWTYSRESYDGVLCSMLLTLAFLLLLIFKQNKSIIYLISASFLLGLTFITRLSMMLAIVAVLGYIVLITQKNIFNCIKSVMIYGLCLTPFLLWQLWYNQLRTGHWATSPVQIDPKYIYLNNFSNNWFVGFWGTLFSPGKSFFIYAPLLIISLILSRKFFRIYPKEALFVLCLTSLWMLLHAKLRNWHGSMAWGPRYWLNILPLMFLPFLTNINYIFAHKRLKFISFFLGLFGFILSLSSMIICWSWRISLASEKVNKGTFLERALEVYKLHEKEMVWGFLTSQTLDTFKGAIANLRNFAKLITGNNPQLLESESLRSYACNTVNFWMNSLIFWGVPWYLVAIAVLILMITIVKSFNYIMDCKDL